MKAYIAGPMTGMQDYNRPAFFAAAATIAARGDEPLNPADEDLTFAHEHADDPDLVRAHYLRDDLALLAQADRIELLDGWRGSPGATWEVGIAQRLRLPIVLHSTGKPIAGLPLLIEAHLTIHGERLDDYLHPLDAFTAAGRMWGAIMDIPDVLPETVGLCMAALKLAREGRHHKRDNLMDAAGYAGCVDMVHEEREQRKT